MASQSFNLIDQEEMSNLLDRISIVERALQGSPYTGSDPTRRNRTPLRHALLASAPYALALTPPSSLVMERSKTDQRGPIHRRRERSLYAGAYAYRLNKTEPQI